MNIRDHVTDNHLTAEQFMDAMVEMLAPAAQQHLETCAQCQSGLEQERARFAAFKEHIFTQAERPENFWQRQSLMIRDRTMEAAGTNQILRWGWAAVAALVLLGALLVQNAPVKQASPDTATKIVTSDQDESMLIDMEATLQRDTPQALEPAEMITNQIPAQSSNERSAHSQNASVKKQKN